MTERATPEIQQFSYRSESFSGMVVCQYAGAAAMSRTVARKRNGMTGTLVEKYRPDRYLIKNILREDVGRLREESLQTLKDAGIDPTQDSGYDDVLERAGAAQFAEPVSLDELEQGQTYLHVQYAEKTGASHVVFRYLSQREVSKPNGKPLRVVEHIPGGLGGARGAPIRLSRDFEPSEIPVHQVDISRRRADAVTMVQPDTVMTEGVHSLLLRKPGWVSLSAFFPLSEADASYIAALTEPAWPRVDLANM